MEQTNKQTILTFSPFPVSYRYLVFPIILFVQKTNRLIRTEIPVMERHCNLFVVGL